MGTRNPRGIRHLSKEIVIGREQEKSVGGLLTVPQTCAIPADAQGPSSRGKEFLLVTIGKFTNAKRSISCNCQIGTGSVSFQAEIYS